MNLFGELSAEVVELVNGLSLPVKVGWPVFVVWVVAQLVWFRRARVEVLPPPMPRAPTVRSSSTSAARPARSSSVARPAASAARAGGSPEFLAALGIDPNPPSTPEP